MIDVRGLTKRYGHKTVVDDLTFRVQPGRVTGFLGPNGSGKSTTMRLICGLDRPDRGGATIGGRPYGRLDWPLREVGALLDAKAFHPGRSARDHLVALARANDLPGARVDVVLEQVGLASADHKRAGTFSLGMGQRLGIAAALLGDPGVLLLDEPVNGLDPEGIRWVRELVRGLAAEGRTVLLSSHLISEMALTADQLVVIGRGHLVAELSMAELEARAPQLVRVRPVYDDERRPLVQLLRGNAMTVAAIASGTLEVTGGDAVEIALAAAAAGIVLAELTPKRSSLEDVFMALTGDAVEYHAAPAATLTPRPLARAPLPAAVASRRSS
ncbi:MAG: ABC transporter ATP-binding protein [Acidimicrobiales bacterium]